MPTLIRLDDILEALHDDRPAVRERAARHLARLARGGLTVDDGLRVLKASTLPYPPRRHRGDDTNVDLVRAVMAVPYPEYLPSIRQRFHLWHDRARMEVLAALVRIEDRRAAETFVELVRGHADTLRKLPLGMFAHSPQFPDVFFPALFDVLDRPRLRFGVYEYALSFAAEHLVEAADLTPVVPPARNDFRKLYRKILPAQRVDGIAWRWDARYHARRWKLGVLLDLFGYMTGADVVAELERSLDGLTDPRLRLYAALSLLRLNRDVDPAEIADIAACPEARKFLFDGLQKLERFHLYPARWRDQAALAESDLVNWLIDANELGRAPEKVELVKVVPFHSGTEDGWLDYYLFRYRTERPAWGGQTGWLVGVAGPFLRKDAPTIQAMGDTHSNYTAWDAKPPREHVRDVLQLSHSWRERHGTTESEVR